MKFVILSHKPIPGYNVKGPILSPATYDIHLVLKWVVAGIDVREVMEDGSYRKLSFNDKRLLAELNKKIEVQSKKREEHKKELKELDNETVKVSGNVKLVPEAKPLPVVNKHKKPKKEQPKKIEEPKKEQIENLIIDDLEKPE